MKFQLEKQTIKNKNYRKVIFTTKQLQLVLMSLDKGQYIKRETHSKTTQFIRVEKGKAIVSLGKRRYILKAGDAIVIPSKTSHELKAISKLKLYSIYSPPEHPRNLIQK